MKNWLKRYILEELETEALIPWRSGLKLEALVNLILLFLAIVIGLPFDLIIAINKGLNEISLYKGESASSASSTIVSVTFDPGSGGGDEDINEIDAMNYYSNVRTSNSVN